MLSRLTRGSTWQGCESRKPVLSPVLEGQLKPSDKAEAGC